MYTIINRMYVITSYGPSETEVMTCQLCGKKQINVRTRVRLRDQSIITKKVLPSLILKRPETAFSFRRCTR